MKRIVLLFFICVAVALMALPGLNPQAAQQRQSSKLLRPKQLPLMARQDPHAGLSYQMERVAEVSQATRDLAKVLPLSRRFAAINSQVRTSTQAEENNNLIDKEIFATLAAREVMPALPATDEEYCRRITLDITGLQPTPERLLKYVSDTDPDKKEKLITELLSSEAYVNRWTNWMGDLVRSFAIDFEARSDRNAEYNFLREALEKNKSFDKVATEILTYEGRFDKGPAGFTIRPLLGVETYQDYFDDLTAETMRTFFGTQAVCVSCHDGKNHLESVNLYFSTRKRSEYWGLSSFFAQTDFRFNTNMVFTNRNGKYDANTNDGARPPRDGGIIQPSYGLLGEGKFDVSENRRAALARLITSDIQFSRAFVNRVFAHFFTLGLVEPLDGFDLARLDPKNPPPEPWQLQASHPVLLNELAAAFQQNGYDMKWLIRLIANSRAYGLSASYDEAKWKDEYTHLYARKLVRRLQAEEVLDAITGATLKPGSYSAIGFSKNFSSAMALPGVEEPSFVRNGPRQSDAPDKVFLFLVDFGRGDRFSIQRSRNSSILQALSLFNNDILINRINSDDGLPQQLARLLQQNKTSPEQAVAFLYLNTLGRLPSEAETAGLKGRIVEGQQTIADLQWALINRPDFLYNY